MADTLREYLISLGFRVDEASWKRYTSAVANAAAVTTELGSGAIATATAIEVAVAKVARQYESLYYVSRRTEQSAQYIQSAQFAFRQIGLTADDATSSIEGVAAAMRLNPGLRALFGGATKPEDIVGNLKSSGLPYFVAARLGGMAGLSEKVFKQIWDFGPEEKKAAEDHARRMREAGIDVDDASKKFTEFSRVLNRLEDDFDVLGTRMGLDFLGPVERGVDAFDKLTQYISKMDSTTRGWVVTLGTLASTVGGSVILSRLFGKIFGVEAAAKVTLSGVVGGAARGAMSVMRAGYGLGPAGILLASTVPANEDEASRKWNVPLEGPGPGGSSSNKEQQIVDYFVSQGWTREQAIGIAANLKRESSLNPLNSNRQGFFGLAQWDTSRRANFAKWAGHPIENSTFDEQLAFVQYELTHGESFAGGMLKKANTAGGAALTVSKFYERTDHPEREEPLRVAMANDLSRSLGQQQSGGDTTITNIHQKTDIHVASTDPHEAANSVRRAQDQVNGNLLRNSKGAIR